MCVRSSIQIMKSITQIQHSKLSDVFVATLQLPLRSRTSCNRIRQQLSLLLQVSVQAALYDDSRNLIAKHTNELQSAARGENQLSEIFECE